jgi:hypothetical protein
MSLADSRTTLPSIDFLHDPSALLQKSPQLLPFNKEESRMKRRKPVPTREKKRTTAPTRRFSDSLATSHI